MCVARRFDHLASDERSVLSDVLVVTVPIAARYPSVNHTGQDGMRTGRKSPEYRELFAAIKESAEIEMAHFGWSKATDLVHTTIVLYRSTKRRQDAGNVAKCELDALTVAGVWEDDSLAKPVVLDIEYDPSGPDRVVIILRKRRTEAVAPPAQSCIVKLKKQAPFAEIADKSDPMGEVNGKPVRRSEILRQIGAMQRR